MGKFRTTVSHFEEFGNMPKKGMKRIPGRTELLADVVEYKDFVSVTLEIPGVEKNDIELSVTEDMLTIDVDTPKRKYHKDIVIPWKIIPGSTHATYKNGILDIEVKKNIQEQKKKKKVQIV